MNLQTAVVFSLFLSVTAFGSMNYVLKRYGLVKYNIVIMSLAGAVLNVLLSLLHELAHAGMAKFWGISVVWGGNVRGMYVIATPNIYDMAPIVQASVALAGPLISALAAVTFWRALCLTRKASAIALLTYLLYQTALGGVGPLFFVISGDAVNFAQGLAKLLTIPIEYIGMTLIVSSIILIYAVAKRCVESYKSLKELALK